MEEAVAVRRAAEDALRDVVPGDLRAAIEAHVADGSTVPGVLTLLSARTVTDEDADAAPAGLTERAAGVQLIYDGLRLTRDLAHDEPWVAGDREGGDRVQGDGHVGRDHDEGGHDWTASGRAKRATDLDILAADVLVARGFYLLARTDAADAAVEAVRAFGRDQTRRQEADDPAAVDRKLEADVLELAALAGVTAVGERVTSGLRAFAADLATSANGQFPESGVVFSEGTRERLARVADASEGSRALNRND